MTPLQETRPRETGEHKGKVPGVCPVLLSPAPSPHLLEQNRGAGHTNGLPLDIQHPMPTPGISARETHTDTGAALGVPSSKGDTSAQEMKARD